MSQQSTLGILDTWCDEVGCQFHATKVKVKGKIEHTKYTNNLRELGWSFRLRKGLEKKYVVNRFRHRCPNCSRTDKKGRLR